MTTRNWECSAGSAKFWVRIADEPKRNASIGYTDHNQREYFVRTYESTPERVKDKVVVRYEVPADVVTNEKLGGIYTPGKSSIDSKDVLFVERPFANGKSFVPTFFEVNRMCSILVDFALPEVEDLDPCADFDLLSGANPDLEAMLFIEGH